MSKEFQENATKQLPALVFTKKQNSTLQQCIEILGWYHKNGKNQSATACHFDPIYPNLRVSQPLISAWLKEEDKHRAAFEGSVNANGAKCACQTEYPRVNKMMLLWVSKAMADDLLLTCEVLRQKWNTFADMAGIPADDRLKLSNGWLDRLKKRLGLKEWKRHGEAASANAKTIENKRMRIWNLI